MQSPGVERVYNMMSGVTPLSPAASPMCHLWTLMDSLRPDAYSGSIITSPLSGAAQSAAWSRPV